MSRILMGLMYPGSAVAFAAVCLCSAWAHWLINVGLLVVACFGAYTCLRLLIFAAGSLSRMRSMNHCPLQYRDVIRKHLTELRKNWPDLPGESELRRGMWQLVAIGIASGLAFLFAALVVICRIPAG